MNGRFKIKTHKELRIAISGFSGCGNTTVSNLLAQKLNLPCINYTFKNVAEELNIPFSEVLKKAQTDFIFDKMVDSRQTELASKTSCVLGSRLAIWLLQSADLKVYLTASPDVRAERIYEREGGDIDAIKRITSFRDKDDTRRYKKLYNIDNTEYGFADLIIDTEKNTPEQIVKIILKELKIRNLIS